jgi:hypothetical protein
VVNLIPRPDGVSAWQAALLEPLAVGLNTVDRTRLLLGETVVVLGQGPIGLALTGGRGADTVIETSGFPASSAIVLDCVRSSWSAPDAWTSRRWARTASRSTTSPRRSGPLPASTTARSRSSSPRPRARTDVDYAAMQAAFFAPRTEPEQTGWASSARRLRDAVEPLATVSFWAEPVYDRYAALGLDFLTGYVWSRSSVLGEAEPAVVAAAFGVFEPGAVAGLLGAARAACSLADVRAARQQGAAAALREVLGDADGLDEVLGALREAAVGADVAGRPLYAGARAQPFPEDRHAALWHAATLVRECRGDSHLGACVAAGLSGLQANLLTELWVGYEPFAYAGTRAWSPEAMTTAQEQLRERGLLDGDRLSERGHALRRQVEQATDTAMAPVLDALGDRLDLVVEHCDAWGAALVERGWFPPDTHKRAAG